MNTELPYIEVDTNGKVIIVEDPEFDLETELSNS